MAREQFNARLPEFTIDQIEKLAAKHGLTKTQVVIIAIDRLAVSLGHRKGYSKTELDKILRNVQKDEKKKSG